MRSTYIINMGQKHFFPILYSRPRVFHRDTLKFLEMIPKFLSGIADFNKKVFNRPRHGLELNLIFE